jgi:hypothetical protein
MDRLVVDMLDIYMYGDLGPMNNPKISGLDLSTARSCVLSILKSQKRDMQRIQWLCSLVAPPIHLHVHTYSPPSIQEKKRRCGRRYSRVFAITEARAK